MARNELSEAQVQAVAAGVVSSLQQKAQWVPLGISNRHLHLCQADLEQLFGPGHRLTFRNALAQPGQYATEETVTLEGPKGRLEKVRVLGPLRAQTQIEISLADGFKLGVKPPVRDSGNLADSPGVALLGPLGRVDKPQGVITAWRHIHLDPFSAALLRLRDKQLVDVQVGQTRGAVLQQVLIRVSPQFLPEMHLDLDEANAVAVKNGDLAKILLDTNPR